MSVVVGGTALAGGSGSGLGTVLGVLLSIVLSSCMNMLGTHDNPRILTLLGTFPKEAPHTLSLIHL